MLADSTTGILIGETQVSDYTTSATVPNEIPAYSYYRIGGTSVSSPLFTGMMALVDQALTEQAGTATSAGFANPTMYPFDTEGDGAFRDPQIGRSPTGERLGSSAAQVLTGCDSSGECTGAGPGVVPVVAEVRADFTDTANDGQYTGSTDPVTGAVPTGATAGNPVIFHLRAEGILGTLEDLPGYDDSTGLGSPDAPQFIAAWLASGAGVTRPSLPIALPDASIPVVFLVIGAVVGTAVVTRRRRRGGLAV
jgi:hypothetical protein